MTSCGVRETVPDTSSYGAEDMVVIARHSLRCRGQSYSYSEMKFAVVSIFEEEREASVHTVSRCCALQYQALWHRLHHIVVGRQHKVQG